jgi:3-hydroxybutyryl-CoA dehydrogenase
MGSGIAQVAAMAGYKTIQFDQKEQMLVKSKTAIETNLAKLADRQKITGADREGALNNLKFTTDISDCKADLIIEAIVEDKDAKVDLFNKLAAFTADNTIFATNTSSISVTQIASGIKNPARVAGMHFFNPAPVMQLVEVIKTTYVDAGVIASVVQAAQQMGKTPVVCNDAPGFIANRVARHYYLEAMKLVELGLADSKTIDGLMEATGFKMGPFKLMDLIGLDVNYAVSNIVWEALGRPERLTPSHLQRAKVEAGELGRKTGKGFYDPAV